ncbi:MAG: MarR family winged helix-turn-helix transcriptional regulator [Thermoplasmatota archaeon]
MATTADAVAARCMDVIPAANGLIRTTFRDNPEAALTVPQLRAVSLLLRKGGASVGDISRHLGIGLPAASKLVGALVGRGYVAREASTDDRRRVILTATAAGKATREAMRAAARRSLVQYFESIPSADRDAIVRGLDKLELAVRAAAAAPPSPRAGTAPTNRRS